MRIDVRKPILNENDRVALLNAKRLSDAKLVGVNVLASPGAGKTSLLSRVLQALPANLRSGVIEGDVASAIDTEKIRQLGFPATQINTDGGCHLSATMVAGAIETLGLTGPGFIFIENIGNLICPAEFKLGESLRLVIANVAEGDDKPIKYPAVFASADVVVLNKIDLVEHVEFRQQFFETGLRAVNPDAPLLPISCRTGQGVQALVDWLVSAARF